MAANNSKDSVFQITDSGGTLRDLSSYLNSVDGLPGERELNEKTALGDSGRKYITGLENVTVSLEGHYDNTATSGPDVVLGSLRTHTAAVAFDYGPEGSSTADSDVKYSGNCFVRSYVLSSRVGDIVAFRCELQVDGAVTRGTY